MEDKSKEELAKQVIQTVDSLNKTIANVDGVSFTYGLMESVSLFEFIWHVAAPNGIRFHIQKPTARKIKRKVEIEEEDEDDFISESVNKI
jgi:hypothetical protein